MFVNGIEIIKFEAKDSKIVASPICLGYISKDLLTDNVRKCSFTGYVYNFSVGYDAIGVDDIKDIHKYLMKKNKYVSMCLKTIISKQHIKMFVFIKRVFYIGSLFLSSLVSTTSLNCISINNQACKVRPEIINVNSNEPPFYPFSIKASKCSVKN